MKIKRKVLQVLLSILIWGLFLWVPRLSIPGSVYEYINNANQVAVYLTNSFILIVLFYLNYYFAIPKYFVKKRYLSYATFIIIIGAVRVSLYYLTDSIFMGTLETGAFAPIDFQSKLFSNLLVIAASFAIYYYGIFRFQEEEKAKSELLALKRQINPHFLFNTLNMIYGQAITKSESTAQSVSKLSSMMRYVLSDANQEMVYLEQELKYVQNYIDLQKYRLTEKTTINFSVKGDVSDVKIPPLIMINFIENAFKYGVSNEVDTNINIDVKVKNGVLYLAVSNNKPQITELKTDSSQIGMKNTLNRLRLIYGENFNLKIDDREKSFNVELKIILHA